MRELAVSGFYPLEDYLDPIAEAISQNNVGGVIKKFSITIGLRRNVWKKTEFKSGLIPSKQSMRLAIAEYLENEKYV